MNWLDVADGERCDCGCPAIDHAVAEPHNCDHRTRCLCKGWKRFIDAQARLSVLPVPYVPDLMVPMYDAPATPEKAGQDGWYRHFSSLIEKDEPKLTAITLAMGKADLEQLRHEIIGGKPVTGTVTFRMVDDVLVAQLVSFTAFA